MSGHEVPIVALGLILATAAAAPPGLARAADPLPGWISRGNAGTLREMA
jgi:hypothetical protein